MPNPIPPFPSENDYPPESTPADVDGSGNDLPTVLGALGDFANTIDTTIDTRASAVLSDHIQGISGPHSASAIVNVPNGTISATNVQAALNELDNEKVPTGHLTATVAHTAASISVTPTGGITQTEVQAALVGIDTRLTLDGLTDVDTAGKINNSVIKWSAGSSKWVVGVDNDSGAGTGATQLDELSDVDLAGQADGNGLVRVAGVWKPVDIATQAELTAHTGLSTGAHAASAVSFAPTGTLAATTVQTAVAEAASEAVQRSNNLSDVTNTATARTNLGLGSMATQAASGVLITGGGISGITDLAIADGGTSASTATQALINLGGAPLSHVHTYASLSDVNTAGIAVGSVPKWSGTAWTMGTDLNSTVPYAERFFIDGIATAGVQNARFQMRGTWTIKEVAVDANIGPSGGTGMTFDLLMNGSSVWTTPQRLTLASGSSRNRTTTFTTTAVPDNAQFQLQVINAGTGSPSDLTISVWFWSVTP